MKDIVIIGAGVSGISAAIYSASRGMKIALIEKNQLGGLINNVSQISHYAGIIVGETGEMFINRAKKQLKELNVQTIEETVIQVDFSQNIKKVITDKAEYQAKTVIIATGTTPNIIGFEGEKELYGKAVFYQAIHNTEAFEDKEIVLVGGSDGAAKEALYLSQIAKKVHLVFVEEKLACIAEFANKIESASNIQLYPHSSIIKAGQKDEDLLVTLKDNASETTEVLQLQRGGIFIYAGGRPLNDIFQGQITMENGFITTDNDMQTSVEGVYAVGDIRAKKVRQVSTAVSDGTIAAIMAFQSLKI